jgi:hypothetical protein
MSIDSKRFAPDDEEEEVQVLCTKCNMDYLFPYAWIEQMLSYGFVRCPHCDGLMVISEVQHG